MQDPIPMDEEETKRDRLNDLKAVANVFGANDRIKSEWLDLVGKSRPRSAEEIVKEVHEIVFYVENHTRKLLASYVTSLMGMMPVKKTAAELYPNVVKRPDEEYAMACEGKNMYNAALEEVLSVLRGEIGKLSE